MAVQTAQIPAEPEERLFFENALKSSPCWPRPLSPMAMFTWRLFDIAAAIAILVMVLPLLAVLAIVLYLSDPGPLSIAIAGSVFGADISTASSSAP